LTSAWSQAQELYRSSRGFASWLQMDTAQQLHLYVRETLSNALLSHAIKTSAGWTWVETIELPGEVDLMWPDHADGLRLFDAASQEETIYSRRQDETYSPLRKRIAGLDLRARKTLLNGRNALHVFWTAVVSIPGGSATAVHHQCFGADEQVSRIELPSRYDSAGALHRGVDESGWFALAWTVGREIQVALWDSCIQIEQVTAPSPITQMPSLEAVAVDNATKKVCIVRRAFLDETHEVVCALLQ